jgi:hypothetical protein
VPAPWCGYTTLSPTLYKVDLPFLWVYLARTPTAANPVGDASSIPKTA